MRAAAGLLAGFLLPLLGLGATAYVLGRMAAWRLAFAGRVERGAVSLALGLGLTGHALCLLGLAGLLRPLPVLLLAAAVHAAGAPAWRELLSGLRRLPPPRWWIWPAAAAGLAPLVALALYPPTAFDATLYHLPFARAFVASGGLPFLPDLRVPIFPQLNELLFAAVLMFGRDVAAHGVQLLATMATAALGAAWARELAPDWRPAAWLAAAVYLGNPIAVHLAGSGYIEPGLALFVTASLFALDRWRRTGASGWLALSALFGATAADVKYLGLFFLAFAGSAVLLAGGRSRALRRRLRDALLFAAVAAACLAPWYLRIYLATGNPVFPFLTGFFGASPWRSLPWPGAEEALGDRLARWLRMPWDVVFDRQRYNQQPPFSPVYLAALPWLVFGAVRLAAVRRLLAVAAAYALLVTWLPSDSRYLVSILPLASVACAGAAAAAVRRWPALGGRRTAAALCLLCVLPGWLYAGYRIARQGPPPATAAAREAYLARRLPLYPAVAWLNRTRGGAYTVWALHAENLVYFARGRLLGDWNGPASFGRVLSRSPNAAALHRELRRLGATHLLVREDPAMGDRAMQLPFPRDGEFRRWFALVYRDSRARIYALRPAPGPRLTAPAGPPPAAPAGRTRPTAGTGGRT